MDQGRRRFLGLRTSSSGGSFSAGQAASHWTPVFDAGACNGCDACVSMCPTRAIEYVEDGEGAAYVVRPSQCNGCRECIGICDRGAVTVVAGRSEGTGSRLTLSRRNCVRCGIDFHEPAANAAGDRRCRICRLRSQNLFQVRG